MPENPVDVVVSGAGPTGLMIACELALAGVRPVVLDGLAGPNTEQRANGLVGQVNRMLDMRGLYHEFGGPPGPPQPADSFQFAGMPLSFAAVTDNPFYALMISQSRLVRLLARRAQGLGVDIRWGQELTDLVQHDGGVTLSVTGPDGAHELTTRYLVGADGGRSLVRKSLGIGFPGSTTPVVVRIAHVHLPDELRTGDGGIDIPGVGRFPAGHTRLERGVFFFGDLESGLLVGTTEFSDPVPDDTPITFQEVCESVRRVLGVDLPIEPPRGAGPHALRRIDGQNSRQADRYRDGNVLLVGDSAHVHYAMGGPGLNLGLHDAINLGWKLAATVNGWAPTELLDTYHSERYPVGERVMLESLSQSALIAPGPEVSALRVLLGELLALPEAAAYIAHLLAGSQVHYDVGDPHPLSGRLVPDLTLDTGQRVAELMHKARPVLLDLTGGAFAEPAQPWRDRVDAAIVHSPDAPAAAMLIRPDGYVAWAADGFTPADVDRLHAALTRWFGPADGGRQGTDSAAHPGSRPQ